jgi:hypothetical protein
MIATVRDPSHSLSDSSVLNCSPYSGLRCSRSRMVFTISMLVACSAAFKREAIVLQISQLHNLVMLHFHQLMACLIRTHAGEDQWR